MPPGQAIEACLRRYAGFRGRARRAEFWWWTLAVAVFAVLFDRLDRALFGSVTELASGVVNARYDPYLSGLFWLLVALPSLAVSVRRLHDGNRSGWWLLLPTLLAAAFAAIGFLTLLFALGYGLDDDMVMLVWVSGASWLAATLVVVFWLARRGTMGVNRFGPAPLGPDPRDPPSSGGGDESQARSRVPPVPRA